MKSQTLSLKLIVADPLNPRQTFEPKAMRLLEGSIASHGIQNPLVVEVMPGKDTFLLVDGERRYRASKSLDLKEVPVIIREPMSDLERLVVRFHLQDQHRPWSWYDKSRSMKTLIKGSGLTFVEIGEMLGVPAQEVNALLAMAELRKDTVDKINEAKIPMRYVQRIAPIAKTLEDRKLGNDLAHALVEKVESGVISSASDVTHIAQAIKAKGKVVIDRLISNKDFGASEATKMADISGIVSARKGTAMIGSFLSGMKALLDNHRDIEMSKDSLKNLKAIQTIIGDFLKTQ